MARKYNNEISIRVDEELYELLLKEQAKRTPKGDDVGLSTLVRVLLHEALGKKGKS